MRSKIARFIALMVIHSLCVQVWAASAQAANATLSAHEAQSASSQVPQAKAQATPDNSTPRKKLSLNSFYEQKFTTLESFKSPPRAEQDKMLLEVFEQRKTRVLNNKIFRSFATLVVGYAAIFSGVYYLHTKLAPALSSGNLAATLVGWARGFLPNSQGNDDHLQQSSAWASTVSLAKLYGMLLFVAVGGYFGYQHMKKAHFEFAQGMLERFWTGREQGRFEELEREYFLKKLFIAPQLQPFIETQLTKLNKGLITHTSFDKILEGLKIALGLYRDEGKPIAYNPEYFEEKFAGYKKNVRDTYRMFYLGQAFRQSDAGDAITLLLKGAPGTGKTISLQFLADVMNVAVIKITGSETAEELFGSKDDPGFLARLMAAQGDGRDYILFVDEFNRGNPNLNLLLSLYDPSVKDYFNPYYQCKVSLPKLRVGAGNDLVWDAALLNRGYIVEFTGFEKVYKRDVLEGKLKAYLKELSANGVHTLTFEELSKEQFSIIDDIIDKDEDIGFRSSSKVIYFLAVHLLDKKYNPQVATPDFIEILRQQNAYLKAGYVK